MSQQVEEERQVKREERQQRALELRRQRAVELQENYLRKRQARDDRVDAATAATETKRREETLRKRRQLAERQREIDEKRRQEEEARALRAKQLADEERCRQEQEREAQRQREAERIARERAELARLAERQAALRTQEVAAAKSASAMNSTFTLKEEARMAPPRTPVVSAPTSYDITPGRDELPPKPLTDPNNYNIDDLGSDQSTDDEVEPRKVIPAWASGSRLQAALIAQVYHAVNADKVFPREDLFPDVRLEKIFSIPRRVFFKRTSSAVWDTPPLAKRTK